ncbi:MAG TPA: hypothetical protein VFQ45_16900 [Longimicrobium sp.]|nr:hypothetical protein [Longimicrobium sp.]
MPIPDDVLSAKHAISRRYLRPIAIAAAPRGYETSMAAAVERASENVHAVGVGLKWVAGSETPVPSVRFYVTQKLPRALISEADRLPSEIDGIPTDIIESPPALVMATPSCSLARQQRQRPVIGGISVAHPNVTAGTLGCFCRSSDPKDRDDVFVLSNNHVFADVNRASTGDALWQPGPRDGGTAADGIATLHRYVRIALGGSIPNRVDAALGRLNDDVPFVPEVCSIGPIAGVARAEEEMLVRKHGRTTGYTEGIVSDESYDAVVGMDHHNPAVVALFQDQFRIERIAPFPEFALGGDSGSVVVRKEGPEAVGLFFAGPPGGNYGIANHIGDVLRDLRIRI